MQVGLSLDQFDPRRGGAERWSWLYASELVRRGHEVHVVARRFGEQTAELPIIAHPLARAGSRLDFAAKAEEKLRSLKLDVVHDLGWGWYCDVFQPRGGSWQANVEQKLLQLPRWLRPLKARVDRLLPRHREYKALQSRQYADHGQIVVGLSQRVANDFHRLHDVEPERTRVVYNGIDSEWFSPARCNPHREAVRNRLGLQHDTLLLMIAAHNFSLKGVPTLLRVMSRLRVRQAPVHLLVVGGRRILRYSVAAQRMGIGQAVTFTGAVDDPLPYYAAADVYVHPTYYDSFGLVILEAAACGLPVITSRFAGAAELLSEGVDGHVLQDPSDVEELLTRLRPMFDPALRRRMGAEARQMALKHPFSHNVDELLDIYGEILDRRKRPLAA